jgi:CRP-like cAMP-binding protein
MVAGVIGSMTQILSRADLVENEKNDKIDSVMTFLRGRSVPLPLQEKICSYLNYIWGTGQSAYHQSLVNELPELLSLQLKIALKQNLINVLPMFEACELSTTLAIIHMLRRRIVLPEEVVMRQGEFGDRVYFVSRGRLNVWQTNDATGVEVHLNEIHAGSYFGELALFESSARSATIIAETFSELEELLKEDFEMLITRHQDLADYFFNDERNKYPAKDADTPAPKRAVRRKSSLLTRKLSFGASTKDLSRKLSACEPSDEQGTASWNEQPFPPPSTQAGLDGKGLDGSPDPADDESTQIWKQQARRRISNGGGGISSKGLLQPATGTTGEGLISPVKDENAPNGSAEEQQNPMAGINWKVSADGRTDSRKASTDGCANRKASLDGLHRRVSQTRRRSQNDNEMRMNNLLALQQSAAKDLLGTQSSKISSNPPDSSPTVGSADQKAGANTSQTASGELNFDTKPDPKSQADTRRGSTRRKCSVDNLLQLQATNKTSARDLLARRASSTNRKGEAGDE